MKKIFTLFTFSFYLLNIHAQPLGSNPNQQDWQIIKFDAGSVIFPKGMENQADRVANIINYQNQNLDRSVGPLKNKIPIIFQNQTVIPNGNVTTGPYRSRFYATSFEGFDRLGTMDWFDVLAIHEYRHVQQINNTKYGVAKLAKFLFGDNGWTTSIFLSIPSWYFEGDAVVAETMFTKAGRGRTPHFTLQQRAMAYADINPNYTLASNISYKSNLPNQYPRGFMMLTHLRNEKGNDVIKEVLKDAAALKKIIYPFSRSMKEHTGWTTKDLYGEAWATSKVLWQKKRDNTILKPTNSITKMNEKVYTEYSFPFFDKNNNVVVRKNSYDTTSEIVRIEKDTETTITRPGISIAPYFQYKEGKALWTELNYNARRNNESYSNIIYCDLETNKKQKLTTKGKFFSPAFGNTTEDIYAIHQSPFQISSLHKVNARTGSTEVLLSFQEGDNVARLQADKNSLIYIVKRKSELSIWKYDIKSKSETQLTPWTAHVIDQLHLHGDHIYYMASFTGIENIYRTPLNGNQTIQQLSSVPIGAFYPSISHDGKTLLFTEHTYMGSIISTMDIGQYNDRELTSLSFKEPVQMEWQDKVAAETEGGSILDKIPTENFTPENYKGPFKGLRLHSWSLFPEGESINLGLESLNLLEDVSADLSAGVNFNNGQNFVEGKLSFGQLLPIINLTHKIQSENIKQIDQIRNETNVEIEVPLQWFSGNYINTLKPLFSVNNTHLNVEGQEINERFQGINSEFSYSFLRQQARQNLGPRFGFTTDLRFQKNFTNTTSDRFTGKAELYLPGVKKNHSIKLTAGLQLTNAETLSTFEDNFVYPRGFTDPETKDFRKISADYIFPMLYPDKGIRGLVFLQRVSTNLFFDVGIGKDQGTELTNDYRSFGFDLIFDTYVLNLLPVGFGFRNSFLLTEDPISPNRVYMPDFFITVDL